MLFIAIDLTDGLIPVHCCAETVLDERNAQIAALEKRIDQQELKADDIEQMTKERVRLSEQITLITERQKEAQNNIWQEETHIAEQMDNVRWSGLQAQIACCSH